jgi:hypothetical protein
LAAKPRTFLASFFLMMNRFWDGCSREAWQSNSLVGVHAAGGEGNNLGN